ncbi:MAG TPA: ABC transporter permease [Candidatus Sulfopaludibacter sp.]|jgi:predicted permease|nr:ABC transporter permease [Candidatus Sulfopaludibacter sp.]
MRTFLQDFRFALRILSGNPGLAAVAALTLALGIASTATVFSWIDSLLLHPFPGSVRSEELAVLEMSIPSAPNGGTSVSWLDYTDFRDHLQLVRGLSPQRYCSLSIGDPDSARLAWGELVGAGYFEVLRVPPLLGRMFVSGDNGDTPGAYPVTVISERLWRSYFHSDPAIVGKTVRVNRRQLTVVGVAPAVFRGTAPAMLLDLWVPASMGVDLGLMGDTAYKDRTYRDFASMVVRLKPGVSIEAARAEAVAVAASLTKAYPNTNKGVSATVLPPWRAHSGTGDLLLSPLRILMAVSVVLLLIVCANVANLLLARSVMRQREFGIRIALGASRWRVARQLMTETLLLAALGSAAGILLLSWMWNSLLFLVPDVGLPIAREFVLNGRIVGFTAVCCVFCTLISGAAPALFSARASLNEVLKEGGRGGMGGATHRTRNLLVIAEVALAAVALVGAGLFARSFWNLRQIHPGFESGNVLFGRFFMEGTGFTGEQQSEFALRLKRNLESRPGITGVSYTDFVPLSTTAGPYDRVEPEGYVRAAGESMNVNRAAVAPGYFGVVRIPLLKGRDFLESDDRKAAPVMIVNQAFARRYFHTEDAVGRRVKMFGKWMMVVGEARDSAYFNPAESPRPFFYFPFRQVENRLHELDYLVRTAGDPVQAIPTLRRAVLATDPAASSFHPVALSEYIQIALFPQKVAASLTAALGAMCLFLAALGQFSVMSCAVNQRAQEIGVRMAMGARPLDVIGMVVRQGMALVGAGLAVGIAAAFTLARLVSGMLVHVSARDPFTFAAAAVFLALIALAATWLPARRATRVDPMIALRQQ